MKFGTILVPTDFSATGDEAIAVAFQLALEQASRVILVHIVEGFAVPNPLYAHYSTTLSPHEHARIEEEVSTALADRVPVQHRETLAWETAVATGDAAVEVARIAQETGASLIVMASHGRTGLKRLRLGSVAERILHLSACSVMILR